MAVHYVLSLLVSLRIFDIIEVDGFRAIRVAIKQAIKIKSILAILDDIVLLLFLDFFHQTHADVLPPLHSALVKCIIPRNEGFAFTWTKLWGFGKKGLDFSNERHHFTNVKC